MEKKRILFLYSTKNSGHYHAVLAIEKTYRDLFPQTSSLIIEMLNYAYPWFSKLLDKTYIGMLKTIPQLWGYLYDNQDVVEITANLRERLQETNLKKIDHLIKSFQPQVVVCTQAVPCVLVAAWKEKAKGSLALVGVVTDFAAHSYWLHQKVDLYIVGNQEIKEYMVTRGIKASRIKAPGIPVDPIFSQNQDKERAKRQLGLTKTSPAVLIMGGARGVGAMKQIVERLRSLTSHFQLMVVTGNNAQLRRELKEQIAKRKLKAHIWGYTKRIDKLMSAGDLIITKPGGLTSSEALVKELPMLIVKPLPGQEERNTRYLVNQGVAIEVNDVFLLPQLLKNLFAHPYILQKMRINAVRIKKPQASLETVRAINKLAQAKACDYQEYPVAAHL